MHVKALSKEIPFSVELKFSFFRKELLFLPKGIKHRFGELF